MFNKLKLYHFESVDSTNNEAKRLLIKEGGDFLVLADGQTAGRGRQGKSFYSPKGTGIYMSLVIKNGEALSDVVSVTTAAAVAVCRAIESLCDKKPMIKWVNDIYLGTKKIGGILCEAVSSGGKARSVIIGIGLNLSTEEFPDNVPNAASLGAKIDKDKLIEKIVGELDSAINNGYDNFINYYRSRSLIIGKEISFTEKGKTKRAKALEIDSTGGLVIRLPDGKIKTLRSGEITVREIKGE